MKKIHLIATLSALLLVSTLLNSFSQTFIDTDISITDGVISGVVDWGDFNNDGHLDILIIGSNSTKIFKNNGDNTFTELAGTTFFTTGQTSGGWVDFDNDGFLDIVYEGTNNFNNILRVYKNEGNETFTEKLSLGFLSNYGNNLDPGDIDNDGDIDFILTMSTKLVIFENIGNFVFVQHEESVFQDLEHSFCLLRDFDNDGRLDILLTGNSDRNVVLIYKNLGSLNFVLHSTSEGWSEQVNIGDCGDYNGDGYLDLMIVRFYGSVLYTNNGDGTFPTYPTGYLGIAKDGESKFGDVDNDGDLDIVSSEYYQSNIYINDGVGNFSNSVDFGIPDLSGTAISFIDYDYDGDLDFVFTGHESPIDIFKFFQNDLATVNNPPDSPTGLSSTVDGDEVLLSWDPPADDFTNDSSLSYNVVIGSTPGGDDIVKPLPSGSAIGNAQLSRTFRIKNIPQGTYYWKVQAMDNSLSKSAFSMESTFSYSSSIQSYALNAYDIEGSEATFSWSRGNGEHSVVFMKESGTDNPLPVDNSTYTADEQYGLGTQIGTSGWFCIYNGDQQFAKVSGLSAQTEYKIAVMEFSGSPGNEIYTTETSENNTYVFSTGKFTEIKGLNLQTLNGNSLIYIGNSDALWFDFDNDEDLDLFTVGQTGSFLYRNDGSENFVNIGFTAFHGYEMASTCDYNNDGFLDLTLGGGSFVGIYSNNGDNTFTVLPGTSFQGVSNGSSDWFDYDNDGDADLLLSGQRNDNSENASIIYRNNGDSTFTEISDHQITAMKNSTADWGDYNNDGFFDLSISGTNIEGSNKTLIYKNDSLGHFILEQELLNAAGTVSWGDYDSDGFLDLLLVSWEGNYIYKNNGADSLIIQDTIDIGTAYDEDGEWVDYDSDGDLDIITSGYNSREPYTIIVENKGLNTFEIDSLALLTPAGFSALAWGDFDKDGDLDLFLSGNSTDSAFSKIFRNEINIANPAPGAVSGLASSIEKSNALLSWGKLISDNTAAPAMTYNLRVGSSPGSSDITNTLSALNGYRRAAQTGNAGQDTLFKLKNLPLGDYYWSVQAVDNGYSGGPFTAEQSFSIVPVQAKNLSAKIIENNSLLLKWERGNGARCVVFCKETNADIALPVDDDIYLPDSEYGYGDQLGSTGWYCVYNGRSDSAIVSGLTYRSDYSFHVIEYLEENGGKQYFTEVVNGNPGVFSTGLFSEQSSIILNYTTDGYDWGDYDNDGYVDILIPGQPSAIYKNNGDNTFTEVIPAGLPALYDGQANWGDYDNDGDLDFFASGRLGADHYVDPAYAALYRNDAGVFTVESSFSPTPMHISYADWGDLDYDNDLDLVVMGATGPYPNYAPITQVFQNNGDGTFTELVTSLPDLHLGSVEWIDYDNDGYLDIYIEGVEANNDIQADLYRNNGDNTFVRQLQFDFMHHDNGSIDWADFDKDGDQDILQINSRYTIISLYENRGDNFVRILSERHNGGSSGAISWGDYDNDGYLDIIFGNFGPGAIFYKNINGQSFEAQSDVSTKFADVQGLEWCDYDNDGDIDMLVSKNSKKAALYKNNTFMNSGTFPANKKVEAPDFMNAYPSPGGVTLNWNKASKDESPSATLSYNLRIGTSYDSTDILSPIADTSGFRLIPRLGNAFLDTTFLVKGLDPGIYYWSVQGIDQAFQGGTWSETDSFEIRNLQPFFSFDTVCFDLATSFTDQTISSDTITSWKWVFEDGAISTDQHPSHIFSSSGINQVKLIVQAAGYTDSLSQDVFVLPRPSADFNTENVCQGTSADFTNTTLLEGSTVSNWYWDFGDGKSSNLENPAANGYLNTGNYNVKLTAYGDNGCSDTIVKQITVAAFPSATIAAGGNPVFCEGDSLKLSVPGNDTYTYQWKIGGVTISDADSSVYFASGSGDYTVDVTNQLANCLTESPSAASLIVPPSPSSPFIQEGGSTTFCAGDSVDLSVTLNAGLTYQWKLNGGAIGTNSNILTAKSGGSYNLEVTNASGCIATSSNSSNITVQAVPSIPIVNLSGVTTFCEGADLDLSVTTNPAYTYQWMNGDATIANATTNSLKATASGDYHLHITNDNDCVSYTEPVVVTVLPSPGSPTIINSGVETFCTGDSAILSVTNNVNLSYQWKLNGGEIGVNSSNLIAKSSGTYSLQVKNSSACIANALNNISITVNPVPETPAVSISGQNIVCEGQAVVMSAEENTALNYQWLNESTSISSAQLNSYAARSSGSYRLKVTNAFGCSRESQSQNITVNPVPDSPKIDIFGDTEFCAGETVILKVPSKPGNSYIWQENGNPTELTSTQITVSESGNYSMKVINDFNCSANSTNSVLVTKHNLPTLPTIDKDGASIFCDDKSLLLTVPSPEGTDTYQWMESGEPIQGETGNSLTVVESGNYNLRIQNTENCEVQSPVLSIEVNALPDKPIIASENYTENGCKDIDAIILSIANEEANVNYEWIRNDSLIAGETNSSYEDYLIEGNYKVRASRDGCILESDLQIIQYGPMPPKPDIIAEGPSVWYLACSNDSAFSYEWYRNGERIEGANQHIYVAGTKFGEYVVGVSDQSCPNFSDPLSIPLGTGIESDPWAGLKIFPNPTPGLFTLEMDNPIMGDLIIDIHGESGIKILSIKFMKETSHFQTQVDLSGQPAAVYMVGLMLEKHRTSKQLIVE